MGDIGAQRPMWLVYSGEDAKAEIPYVSGIRGFGCYSTKGGVDAKAITVQSIETQHNEIPFYSLLLLSQMERAQSWRGSCQSNK